MHVIMECPGPMSWGSPGAGSRPPAHRGLTPGAAGLSGKADKMPRLALALWPPWARRPPGPPPLLQPLETGPAGFASEPRRGACRKCQVAHLALRALARARAPVTEQRGTMASVMWCSEKDRLFHGAASSQRPVRRLCLRHSLGSRQVTSHMSCRSLRAAQCIVCSLASVWHLC